MAETSAAGDFPAEWTWSNTTAAPTSSTSSTITYSGYFCGSCQSWVQGFHNCTGWMTHQHPHRCPVCEGKGTVGARFYPETKGKARQSCRSCYGAGILWR